METVKASAPGNLFFCGEHAVVYSHPGVVASVGARTYSQIKEAETVKIVSEIFGEGTANLIEGKLQNIYHEAKEIAPLFEFINHLSNLFEIKKGFEVYITSDIPPESGMSSSTAVLSSMLCALSKFFSWEIKVEDYFDIIFPVQLKIHGGKASGSEIVSSSIGGFNRIQKTQKNGKAKMDFKFLGHAKFSVVIGDTKVRAPTALTVGSHIPSLLERDKGFVEESFEKIAEISKKIESAITKQDANQLGNLMNENQKILFELGLSHPKIDDCIKEALNAGALGAKLSGGGWGGIMFALCEKDKVEKIKKAIESTGSNAIVTSLGGEGVRLEK